MEETTAVEASTSAPTTAPTPTTTEATEPVAAAETTATTGTAEAAPTAAPTEGELTATAEAAPETTPEPVVEAAPEITPGDFDFSTWDGEDYSVFPETSREWLQAFDQAYKSQSDDYQKELDKLKATYEAYLNGWEDPRVKELTSELDQKNQALELAEQRYKNYETAIQKEREVQDTRYINWVKETYAEQAKKAAEVLGDKGEESMNALLDAGYELHVAIDIGTYGLEAVNDAVQLATRLGADDQGEKLALELLQNRYGVSQTTVPATNAAAPEAAPILESESDSMVNGADGARAPNRITDTTPKTPYKGRRARLDQIASKHYSGR